MGGNDGWLLALDLSGPRGIIVLDGPGGMLQHGVEAGSRVSHLFTAIREITSRAGLAPGDIDLVGAARGPGSFTGVRVAVMAAKTLAFSLGIPLVAPDSLAAAAEAAQGLRDAVLVVADARRREIYHCLYGLEEGIPLPLEGPSVSQPQAVAACLPGWSRRISGTLGILGSAVGAFPGLWPQELVLEGLDLPDAAALAMLCRRHLAAGETVDPISLLPLYIRHPDARKRFASAEGSGACS